MEDRTASAAEVTVVLVAMHAPAAITSLVQRAGSDGGSTGGEQAAAWWIDPLSSVGALAQQAGLILLLLYILRLRGVSLRGLDHRRWSVVVAAPCLFAMDIVLVAVSNGSISTIPAAVLGAYQCATSFSPSAVATVVATAGIFVGSVLEECLRTYCITRVGAIFDRPTLGLLASVILSLFDHLYYGPHELLNVGLSALGYGVAYLLTRSVVPLIAAHCLYNVFLLWLWTCSP